MNLTPEKKRRIAATLEKEARWTEIVAGGRSNQEESDRMRREAEELRELAKEVVEL